MSRPPPTRGCWAAGSCCASPRAATGSARTRCCSPAASPEPGRAVVDAGAGVGAVGLAVALRAPVGQREPVERQADLASIARRTSRATAWSTRVRVVACDLLVPAARRAAGSPTARQRGIHQSSLLRAGRRARLAPWRAGAGACAGGGRPRRVDARVPRPARARRTLRDDPPAAGAGADPGGLRGAARRACASCRSMRAREKMPGASSSRAARAAARRSPSRRLSSFTRRTDASRRARKRSIAARRCSSPNESKGRALQRALAIDRLNAHQLR